MRIGDPIIATRVTVGISIFLNSKDSYCYDFFVTNIARLKITTKLNDFTSDSSGIWFNRHFTPGTGNECSFLGKERILGFRLRLN